MGYVNPDTGKIITAYLFVATLPYSQMSYVEATTNRKENAWLSCTLGIEACRQTYRVLYIRMPDLMRNFENYRDDIRVLTRYRERIGNY